MKPIYYLLICIVIFNAVEVQCKINEQIEKDKINSNKPIKSIKTSSYKYHNHYNKKISSHDYEDHEDVNIQQSATTAGPLSSIYQEITKELLSINFEKEISNTFNGFNQFLHSVKILTNIDNKEREKPYRLTLGEAPIKDGLENWSPSKVVENPDNSLLKKKNIENSQSSSGDNSFSEDSSNTNSDSSGDIVIIVTNSTCALGNLTFSSNNVDTCKGQTCFIEDILCNGEIISTNSSLILYNSSINYEECQLLSMSCPYTKQPIQVFNFKEQYGLQSCQINTMTCSDPYLNDCVLNEVICDEFTRFGKQTFGFKCSTNELICNGQVIPRDQYDSHEEEIKNGECQVDNVICSGPQTECLKLEIDCTSPNSNCTLNVLQDTTCLGNCFASQNVSSCICPDDFTGKNCENLTPFTCQLQFNSPIPQCSGPDFIRVNQDCFSFYLENQTNFNLNLNCQFTPPIQNSQSQFNYWIDLPNFKVSKEYPWLFKMEVLNLNRIFNNSFVNSLILEKEQVMGLKTIWNNHTLSDIPSEYWVAKRVYNEIYLQTEFQNKTISKYFIKAIDYPDNSPKEASSKKKTLLIVFGSIGILILVIISLIFYKKKLKIL